MLNTKIKGYNVERKGRIFVVSAPSGTGKTVLVNEILKLKNNFVLSVSYTTRSKRNSEINGKDYVFVSVEKFESLIKEGFFIEHNYILGNYYGVPKFDANNVLKNGKSIIFIIEYNGFRKIKEEYGDDVVGIFILPPSFQELKNRLLNRGADDNFEDRLNNFNEQLSIVEKYDYLIVNDKLDEAINQMNSILTAEELKMSALYFSY